MKDGPRKWKIEDAAGGVFNEFQNMMERLLKGSEPPPHPSRTDSIREMFKRAVVALVDAIDEH